MFLYEKTSIDYLSSKSVILQTAGKWNQKSAVSSHCPSQVVSFKTKSLRDFHSWAVCHATAVLQSSVSTTQYMQYWMTDNKVYHQSKGHHRSHVYYFPQITALLRPGSTCVLYLFRNVHHNILKEQINCLY